MIFLPWNRVDRNDIRLRRLVIAYLILLSIGAVAWAPHPLVAQTFVPPNRSFSAPGRQVVDYENLCVVNAPRFPNDIPTCQVLVVGGGLGGVAAAEALARQGMTVILTEPTSQLGGQLTNQGVSTPDENDLIERNNGPSTQHYRELREQVRHYYKEVHGIVPGRERNVGQCWVSEISGEPSVWERAIRERLAPLEGRFGIRRILLRHALLDVQMYPANGDINYADFLDLDTRRIIRISAHYILDATPTGDVLDMARSPWTIGQEAQSKYDEPDAPAEPHPDWVQSFTYGFIVRWSPNGPQRIIAKPDDFDYFESLGDYNLAYDYGGKRGIVTYNMFTTAPEATGPFWTYRRLVAASSFTENVAYSQDISLINWAGNDYHEDSFIGKPPDEQVRILKRAKAYAQGYLYWLQTKCPRDDGGTGYPEIQPAPDEIGRDGFASFPYIRESRRMITVAPLTERAMIANLDRPEEKSGTEFPDSVGLAQYPIDIHPKRDRPYIAVKTLPYEIPLGAFIAVSGPKNLLPAGLDLGASRLAAASTRVHPTEWLIGEVAGNLAAFCVKHHVVPSDVRANLELLSEFQADLERNGIATRWSQVGKAPGAQHE